MPISTSPFPHLPKLEISLHFPSGSIMSSKAMFNERRNLDFCGTTSTKYVYDIKVIYNFLNSSLTEESMFRMRLLKD